MNTFTNILGFIRSFEEGSKITRKSLMAEVRGRQSTLDQYRLHFTHAGYLKHIGRGLYLLEKKPSLNLYARKLRKEAYPWWMDWHEYRHLSKSFNE
jgi:hypothetical protein